MKPNYCFEAKFKNGEVVYNNFDAISLVNPSKNSFYDVIYREQNGNKCQFFSVISVSDEFSVDLSNGCFGINKTKFYLTTEKITEFSLVYFKTVKKYFGGETESETIYNIGWDGINHAGEKITRIISFK